MYFGKKVFEDVKEVAMNRLDTDRRGEHKSHGTRITSHEALAIEEEATGSGEIQKVQVLKTGSSLARR